MLADEGGSPAEAAFFGKDIETEVNVDESNDEAQNAGLRQKAGGCRTKNSTRGIVR